MGETDLDWFKTESLWVTEMMDTHSPMLFVKSYLVLLYFLMIYNKCLLIFQLCEVYLSEILPLEALAPFCEVCHGSLEGLKRSTLCFLEGFRSLGRGNWREMSRDFVTNRTPTIRLNDIVESIVEKTMKEWPYLKVFEDNWFDTISSECLHTNNKVLVVDIAGVYLNLFRT
ncbi:hypothetical protein P8452_16693 [Trifolium repens]|nr:hypothetical protein P8452_16693 [Trifolium repens]